ncbi:MAG: hypothetical protein ACTSR3_19595 [Candidatus Helarchaeota archaeon]
MPTYVTCINCVKDLPRKYKKRKERKEIFDPVCNACPYKGARKKYEEAIKKGLWLKKYDKAIKNFEKAIKEYTKAGDHRTALIVELMSLMTEFKKNQDKATAIKLISAFVDRRFEQFRTKNFVIPEFEEFYPLFLESISWVIFSKANKITSKWYEKDKFIERTEILKKAAKNFFNIGYRNLFFAKAILDRLALNTQYSLQLEAESEELRAEFHEGWEEYDEASMHYLNAIMSYTNLEKTQKAHELRNKRKALRMERACWICGTRSKGYKIKFDFVYTHELWWSKSYFENILKQRQERNPQLHNDTLYDTADPITVVEDWDRKGPGLYLSVCKGCRSILDEMSDIIAEKKVAPLRRRLDVVENQISRIFRELTTLTQRMNILAQEIKRIGSIVSSR